MAGEWQKRIVRPSFRGVKFYCDEATSTFGRRTAVHEYPQHDIPYIEDMGRKGVVFSLDCYVIGDDWEDQRDKLLTACEQAGSGLLVHPDLGEWTVVCDSCAVVESKVNSARKASFQLTFFETGDNKGALTKVSTQASVISKASEHILNIGTAFAALYKITQLPQYVADVMMDYVGQLTGIYNPYALLNAYDAAQDLLNGDIALPWQVAAGISAYTSAFNNDYSDSGTELVVVDATRDDSYSYKIYSNKDKLERVKTAYADRTNTVKPRDAVELYLRICNVVLINPKPADDVALSRHEQWKAGKHLEVCFKGMAVIEATVAVAKAEVSSLTDAQVIWGEIITAFDAIINTATEVGDDQSFIALRSARAKFHADIQARAPTLAKLIYRSYPVVLPSLAIAYDVYEDIGRAGEIVARNKVRHPGFIRNLNLELVSE